jgi:acyl carrier protein
MNIENEVVTVMAEVLSKKKSDIQPQMELKELVEDSFDLVEMVMTLKDHFQVAVVATEFDQIKTVQDLVAYLDKKVKAKK